MFSLPLAERYTRFRDEVFSGLAEPEVLMPGLTLPKRELELQSLWFAGAFGREFQSRNGEKVKIVDFGVWNASAGPDFIEAVVEINGVSRRGAIELDPDVRDWEHHGHGVNPEYAKVVLHVFLQAPEARFYTRTVDHTEVEQVQLMAEMLEQDARPNLSQAAARLGRCAVPLRQMQDEQVCSLLESAAQHRLERKSRRIHRTVAACGREQAIFQELAKALGYRYNQEAFLLVTQRLPLKRLLCIEPEEREALLFGVSGFLEGTSFEDTKDASRHYLKKLWMNWWKLRDGAARWLEDEWIPKWKIGATRPGNHPQRRLGALSAILQAWSQVSSPLLEAGRWSQALWRESLLGMRHDFWSGHFTLLAEPSSRPVALIGSTRVQEMLANVAYPLLVPERTRLWAEYLELPSLLENEKVSRAALRLFGEGERAQSFKKRLHQQQGLIQLYEDFCLEDNSGCADCPFPERLKEWSC